MSYPLREERAGAYYHVVTRGNNRRDIYTTDRTRLLFMLMLQQRAKRYEWRIVAYCLMNNHYHFVVRLGAKGLSRGMQRLNGGYAYAFNVNEGRRDHVFGRRFWSRELGDADDVIATCAYIDLNPARSFGVAPGAWSWSGYNAAVGASGAAGFHRTDDLWRLIDPRPRAAMAAYEEIVASRL
jgi:putative transposase